MTPRRKKLLGTLAILVFVLCYALVVMTLAQPILTRASTLTQMLFYAIAGLAWVLPIMPLIAWMERRDRT